MFDNIKELKTQIVDFAVCTLRKSNVSDKTLGYMLRSGHFALPVVTSVALVFGNQLYALSTIIILCISYVFFWFFNGCILHSIEYKLDNLDITLMDPLIEMCQMEIIPTTRLRVAQIVAIIYITVAITLYYIRFGSVYLQNNIYDEMNIFKGFYQWKKTSPPNGIVNQIP